MATTNQQAGAARSAAAQVAIYIDFDNIVMSRYDELHGYRAYRNDNAGGRLRSDAIAAKVEEAHVEVSAIIDYASSFGTVAISRAYADWSVHGHAAYSKDLLGSSVDLVQMFPLTGSKNGADIRLAIDVMDDLSRLSHITHVVIVAGDSDYMSLAQRCKRMGRTVIGVGAAKSVGQYFQAACDEFRLYGNLPSLAIANRRSESRARTAASQGQSPGSPDGAAATTAGPTAAGGQARDLMVRALALLAAKSDEEWADAGELKSQMMRLDPAFDERALGFTRFSLFLDAMPDAVETTTRDNLQRLVRPIGEYATEILGEQDGEGPGALEEEVSAEVGAIRQAMGNERQFVAGTAWETECVRFARRLMTLASQEDFTHLGQLRERCLVELYGSEQRPTALQRHASGNVTQLLTLLVRDREGVFGPNPDLEGLSDGDVRSLLRESVASKARHKLYPEEATVSMVVEALYDGEEAPVDAAATFERVLALPTVQMMSETLHPVLLPSAVLWDVADAVVQVSTAYAITSLDVLSVVLKGPLAAMDRDIEAISMNEVHAALTSAGVIAPDEGGNPRNTLHGHRSDEVVGAVLADWVRRLAVAGQVHLDEWTWMDSLYRMVLIDRSQELWRVWVRDTATWAAENAGSPER